MASISFRNVVKRYGGASAPLVIHGASAEVTDGEFVVIVGPSGCGKSTLLRMVAGLESVSGGEIAIGGRVVNDVDPAQRDIAMVFQNYALYPHMSVYDNMAYGLRVRSLPRAEIDERVQRAARTLEIAHLLDRKPRQLSGGQRQRVAMGRAIVRSPQVFLFDEPLSNLDAKLRAQTRLEIRRLHRELGVTSLFVTHDQVEAMTLAQRMMVMSGGHIEQIGSSEDVYLRPATTFVAGFIGSPPMNLLDGQADGSVLHTDGAALTLPQAAPRQGALRLGVRPEHLTPAANGAGWPLRVDTVEMLGAERLVHGHLGASALTLRIDATLPAPSAGTTLAVQAPAQHLHWFDTTSGRRIDR